MNQTHPNKRAVKNNEFVGFSMMQIDIFAHVHTLIGETIQIASHSIQNLIEKYVKSIKKYRHVLIFGIKKSIKIGQCNFN